MIVVESVNMNFVRCTQNEWKKKKKKLTEKVMAFNFVRFIFDFWLWPLDSLSHVWVNHDKVSIEVHSVAFYDTFYLSNDK